MANLYDVHHQVGVDEQRKYVIAADEADVRAYLADQEANSVIEPNWTIFDMGVVEGTPGTFGPTQLTKDPVAGVWNETA